MSDRPKIYDVDWRRFGRQQGFCAPPPLKVVPAEVNVFKHPHSEHPETTCFQVTRTGGVWWCYPESGVGDDDVAAIYDLEGELVGYRALDGWTHMLGHPMGRFAAADEIPFLADALTAACEQHAAVMDVVEGACKVMSDMMADMSATAAAMEDLNALGARTADMDPMELRQRITADGGVVEIPAHTPISIRAYPSAMEDTAPAFDARNYFRDVERRRSLFDSRRDP